MVDFPIDFATTVARAPGRPQGVPRQRKALEAYADWQSFPAARGASRAREDVNAVSKAALKAWLIESATGTADLRKPVRAVVWCGAFEDSELRADAWMSDSDTHVMLTTEGSHRMLSPVRLATTVDVSAPVLFTSAPQSVYPEAKLLSATPDAGFEPHSAMRTIAGPGALMVFLGIALLAISVAAGVAVCWLGAAVFAFGNYASARRHECGWMIGPAVAGYTTFLSLLMSLTAVIAGLTS